MSSTQKTAILVVEAEETSARVLVEKLQAHGLDAESAPHAEQALEMVHEDRFGVVLSDLWLPTQSGFELTHNIRSERISKPEIFLMTDDPKVTLFEAHQAGASYLLKKPVNMDELGLALRRFADIQFTVGASKESLAESTAAMTKLYGQLRTQKQKSEMPVEVSNLGRGGFFAKLEPGHAVLSVGQVVDFNLKLAMVPNCQCSGRGIIRWNYDVMGTTGVGIEFLRVPAWFQEVATSFADLFKVREFIPERG